jgi:hypothetical protein
MSVKIQLELLEDGEVKIRSSMQDGPIIIFMLEKAKLTLLTKVDVKTEQSLIHKPGLN